MSAKCFTCAKTAYAAEKLSAGGKDFHKRCFKCMTCKKKLTSGQQNYLGPEEKLLCKTCYEKEKSVGGKVYTNAQKEEQKSGPPPAPVDATSRPSADGPKFCPGCGTKRADMVAKFCADCGNRF
eukprot:215900_1